MKQSVTDDPQITCPKCKASIRLTESLAAPLIAKSRAQLEQQLSERQSEFARRDAALRKAQALLKIARHSIDEEVAAKLEAERGSLASAEAKRARLAVNAELKSRDRQLSDLQKHLESNNAKLEEAQKAQADVIRQARELKDARREVDLTVQKQVQEALANVQFDAKAEADDRLKAMVSEKEVLIVGMQRQIEELRLKANQGSQQLQGEGLEFQLEGSLRDRFPYDIIESIPVGNFGGDVLQNVRNASGTSCGLMLWEAKNTKTWNDRWLAKLRSDQRAANADLGLIVSIAMPRGIESFDFVDGIWVTKPRYAVPLAIALRQALIEIAEGRQAVDGQRTKTELVYQYLTGTRFRARIDAIIERFTEMQTDLHRERTLTMRLWAKREEQLKSVLDAGAGLCGDLHGIVGSAMPEIESLNVQMIEKR